MATDATTLCTDRARIAGVSSRASRRPNDPDLIEARRNLRELRLEEHVQKILSEAPPLNDEQRNRIAALLRAGGGVHVSQCDRNVVDDHNLPDSGDSVRTSPHASHPVEAMPS